MSQLLSPDAYAALQLPDQFIEDIMQQREAAMLVERLTDCRTVLDLGWGSGIVAKALTAAGKRVTVIEGSQRFADEAAKHVDSVIYDAFENAAMAESYDAVIASFVLEHVADPVALLKRCRTWGRKLIVVAGNANSYHRQIAVKMGLQPRLDSLSERDKVVGHYKIYSLTTLYDDLFSAGWAPVRFQGLMFKALPNFELVKLPRPVIEAMCRMEVSAEYAANIMVECE